MMALVSSLTTSVKPTTGCVRTLLRMLKWCRGGIMATRSQPWQIGLSWWTIILGTTRTSREWDR